MNIKLWDNETELLRLGDHRDGERDPYELLVAVDTDPSDEIPIALRIHTLSRQDYANQGYTFLSVDETMQIIDALFRAVNHVRDANLR